MRTTADQVALLARRSVLRTWRNPAATIFPLIFPMLLLAVNSGGLRAETHLPGFPTRSFVARPVRREPSNHANVRKIA